ncbi:MAG: DNA helicase UvrD [Candidatus Diapherotrites archaeon]|nr:DNA helicase UvrD [Candidatus Diapherotrites archaeon]
MLVRTDLHIHGPYSRGTSKQLSIPNLERYARLKGIDVLGTGDFTHPGWLAHLREHLEERDGLLYTKTGFPFMLTTEISSIYSQDGKTRKIHQVVFAPGFEVVEQIRAELSKHGRLDYDGRPIFGLSAPEIVEIVMGVSRECFIFPAHAWTPWFSLFGSNSGFDSIKDCYQDQLKHIHAIETGLSSDPPMNWRLSQLDGFTLVSFSDSHSFWPWRIGREATTLDCELSYKGITDAIKENKVEYTVEVDPAYGKYHWDGHRNCGIQMSPKEALKHNNICPVCGKPLTIGVLHRVEALADRPEGFKPKGARPFKELLPLSELISATIGKSLNSKAVWVEFNALTRSSNEFEVLLDMPEEELSRRTRPEIASAIMKNRFGQVKVNPGYDGIYGELVLETAGVQKKLSEF